MDTRLADMPFVRCKLELSYCHRLRDAFDGSMEAAERDLELQSLFFKKPYTNMDLTRAGSHRIRALKFEICQRAAVRKLIFLG